MSGPGFVTRRTAQDTHDARNRQGQRPRPPRLPRRHTRWRYVGVGALAAVECVALLSFGILLGLADIAVADTIPAGTGRSIVFVIALGMSISAVLVVNRAVSAAHGRRPRRHRRNLSTDSQAHNLSNRGLSRRFRRGGFSGCRHLGVAAMTMSFSTLTRPHEPFIERCPYCVGEEYLRPMHVTILPDDGAHCFYRCPACLYSWWTSWGTYGEDPKFLWTGRR